jgi:beta-glucosidase
LIEPMPFLWGVATSAYQSEGGYNGPGQPQTNWASIESQGDIARSGNAAEFWSRFDQDFALAERMGMKAFRLGIEWSRVQPTLENAPGNAPAFDTGALQRYAEILIACRSRKLEPIVTLHHFVHPAWLGPDPWLDSRTPELFAIYVREAVSVLNRALIEKNHAPLRYFITINEPNMLVLNTYLGNQFPSRARSGFRTVITAYNQLLIGHIHAYNALHNLYANAGWDAPWVTLNNYCSDLYWSDKVLLDLLSLRERKVHRLSVRRHIFEQSAKFEADFRAARIPLHKDLPYYFGALIKRISNWIGYRFINPENFDALLDVIYASPRSRLFDYVGLDYYDPFAAHAFRLPVFWDRESKLRSFHAWMMNSITSKWWDWRVLPRGLHFFCKNYSAEFERPILIAENGMAIRRKVDNSGSPRRDRMTRSQFLRLHVHEVQRIVKEGIPLFGYLHWSLFDNYEWGSFTPRFGLYSIDYTQNLDRLIEDQSGDRPSETYRDLMSKAGF